MTGKREKIKAGLIWVTSVLNIFDGMPEKERKGCEDIIISLIGMIEQEIKLGASVSKIDMWNDIEPHMEKAVMMIRSGVSHEASTYLSRAISIVTTIAHKSMSALIEKGLL